MQGRFLVDANLGRIGGPEEGFGPFGNLDLSSVSAAAEAFNRVISNAIGIMTIIAGIWFVFMFVIGGYGYLTAGGDSKKISEANSRITTALIGLVVVVSAYALISLIGALLGFKILQPQEFIQNLQPGG